MENVTEEDKSDLENTNSISFEYVPKRGKFEITAGLKEKLVDLPDVLAFILKLQAYIEKQRKKLQKLRKKKHKEKFKKKDESTQTETETVDSKTKTISEEITEAAEQALQGTGFVYEETSGMYYDYNSGYYYNAEYGLYYDGNTGTYLKYNQDTKEYEFHSQVAVPAVKDDPKSLTEKPKKRRIKRKGDKRQDVSHANKRERKVSEADLEEGECSECSVEEEAEAEGESSQEDDGNNSDIDYAKQYPPCMRIIVEESNIASVKPGSLHLITFEGGTIGREGSHSVLIPDINISKHHLSITFDKAANEYRIVDLGSRNGTHLNGKRLSPSKVESDPTVVQHGSRIQIGGTTLLCHIHVGSQTCGHCEPGLLQAKEDSEKSESISTSKAQEHKQQLRQLRKKFGITKGDQGKTEPGCGYMDRAQVRRETIGSQNPHEKTKTASLNESIESDNMGFKMLAKMGWKEGQSLGKDNQGILEPVELVSNPGMLGMGNTKEIAAIAAASTVSQSKYKKQMWSKTQERYNKIPEQVEDIFEDS